MCKFYYPDGREFENQNAFIKFYNDSYYLQNDRVIKGIPQNSEYVERAIELILQYGIRDSDDIIKIIAWKIGSINHAESEKKHKFVYYSGKPDRDRYKRKIPSYPIANFISHQGGITRSERQARECPQEILKGLLKLEGIGPVYAITILYFLSGKMYPIYDQYAHFAIKAISENIAPSDRLITNADLNKEVVLSYSPEVLFSTYKKQYVNRLKKIFGDHYNDRDIDRALWVYGHLFKDTKTNQKRIKQAQD